MTAQKRRTARETLTEMKKTLALMQNEIAKLESTVVPTKPEPRASARGTQEITPVVDVKAEHTLEERIVAALRVRALYIDELVSVVDEPAGRVSRALNKMRKAERLFNLGSDDRPRWHYVIGDDATTAELREACERLLTERPMTLNELAAATGCRHNRISGVLVQFDRDMGKPVLNLGNGKRALWFMPHNADALVAKLKSKRTRSS